MSEAGEKIKTDMERFMEVTEGHVPPEVGVSDWRHGRVAHQGAQHQESEPGDQLLSGVPEGCHLYPTSHPAYPARTSR